ncbi:MAG: HAMP domain-containing protein [Solirubrobacterales bacterium]|nr:HAMP domain-containing protein [Solirubrobacterales bacterium]
MPGRLANLASRPQLPRRTVRLRLTLLYGVLFLLSGAALLAITYLLVSRSTGDRVLFTARAGTPPELQAPGGLDNFPSQGPIPNRLEDTTKQLRAQAANQRDDQLEQLLIQSGIALGVMSIVSIGLGWLIAGRVLGPLRTMTATTRQISEHNLHERLALEGPSDELKDLGDTIDGLLARLEAAFEAQRRFVANASHEMRTPLAMMRTSLDVTAAKPGPVPPELSTLDGKLREGLDRADRLLESFLTLARAQHDGVPEQTTVSLPEIVSATVADRGDAIEAKGIELRWELGPLKVIGSETLLTHLVENVIDNAIRHNETGGWIRVETRAGNPGQVVVESGGPRLEPDAIRDLSQPFRRLGAERTSSQNGIGLGLSIVAAIVNAHGGELDLAAQSEGGLRVRVALPRAETGIVAAGAIA